MKSGRNFPHATHRRNYRRLNQDLCRAVGVVVNEFLIDRGAMKRPTQRAAIAAASKEQAQGIGQVNTAVAEMDKVTQSNAASAEESASAAEELSSQSVQLTEMVGELETLVGGVNKTQGHVTGSTPGTTGTRRAASKKFSTASASKRTAAQVIPLDDAEEGAKSDSFAEFSGASGA
jgi:hypothetical protein